ncbi:MAG: hypothetical protein PUG13_00875 [Streptococcus hyointestinalis]|nr:hypothetical protein [Streptococcus hyointestinalis]MDD6383960.1 hypothetical protein [Streptococcus hyointestinalis]
MTETEKRLSSVGKVEDMLTQIKNMIAIEYHLNILVKKYEDQIEFWYMGGDTSELTDEEKKELSKTEDNLFFAETELIDITGSRREAMKALLALANESGNKDLWCTLKHALIAEITAFEVWQVDLKDIKSKDRFLDAERRTNRFVARFLGYEVTACSACLADQLEQDGL